MPKKINVNQKTDKSNSNNICNKLTKKAKKKKAYFIKNKEIQKQLTNDNELVKKGNEKKNVTKGILLRNITHKESVGCNNWKKFIAMENCNPKNKSKNISNANKTEKLPLMKSGSLNENNKFLSSLFTFRRPKQQPKITKVIGMDCEMVGVGENGSVSIVARVSLVNSFGECIYDKYVKPTETVTDYRTFVSGIRPHHIEDGEDFFTVQKEVANLLKGRTLVGHALKHDLQVLILRHPRKYIRDTTTFLKFRREAKGTLSLKNLSKEFLNVKIQHGEHDSVEDARAAMQLYMTYRKEWEQERREKWLAAKSSKKPVVSDVVCETI